MKENIDTERETKKRVDMTNAKICLLMSGVGFIQGLVFHGISLFTNKPLPLVLAVIMFTMLPLGWATMFIFDYWFFVLKRRFKNRAQI